MQEYQGMKLTHSLRTTNVTWLFDCDVDKRLIMERTGHLSSKGVRLHKHTSKAQHEKFLTKKSCL